MIIEQNQYIYQLYIDILFSKNIFRNLKLIFISNKLNKNYFIFYNHIFSPFFKYINLIVFLINIKYLLYYILYTIYYIILTIHVSRLEFTLRILCNFSILEQLSSLTIPTFKILLSSIGAYSLLRVYW